MDVEIAPLWQKICQHLQKKNWETLNDLNPPCSEKNIEEIEHKLGFTISDSLRSLYRINNGQKGAGPSLFQIEKSKFDLAIGLVGGCRFLPVDEILPVWNELMNDKELVDDIKLDRHDIPFAKDKAYDILSINGLTGAIFAIWTGGPDWTLPRDWQTIRKEIAPNLGQFLTRVFFE